MERKTFAFKLAEQRPEPGKWQARSGIALASCSEVQFGNYRRWDGQRDSGSFC